MRRQSRFVRDEDGVATLLGPQPLAAAPIRGSGDDDVLHGTADKDRILGLGGDDQLFGMAGRDVLVGGAGADRLDGGAGIDVADYGGTQAISITFDKSGTSTVHVAGDSDDTITGIERINGSDASDTFDLTAAKPKSIFSGGGDDTFYVDPLKIDFQKVGISGGDGFDTLDASHDTAPAGFVPDKLTNLNLGYSSDIENIIGSRFADSIGTGRADTVTVHGMDGDDQIIGYGFGARFLFGDGGDDQLTMFGVDGELHGNTGDDLLIFRFRFQDQPDPAALLVDGGDGNDTVWYQFSDDFTSIVFELGRDDEDGSYTLSDGTSGVLRSIENVDQSFRGTTSGLRATIYGNEAANVLTGSVFDDVIAANGKTTSTAGGDATIDTLTGGPGADIFLITDVTAGRGRTIATDRITDFSQNAHDKIDLSQVDSRPRTASIDDFQFIGAGAFTGHAGELRYEVGDGVTMLMADTNGDTAADFALRLDGEITLTKADFVL